jgi:hypothetical protein
MGNESERYRDTANSLDGQRFGQQTADCPSPKESQGRGPNFSRGGPKMLDIFGNILKIEVENILKNVFFIPP